MVVQTRKDPERGSQELFSLSEFALHLGGVIGCIGGGLTTQYRMPTLAFLA